ncbi:hypothetical protein L596_016772 [Steinernema carpocapsae]|uniref:EGF-like domain-containing protein n=1 Tax=Steinernema carpocapsae TaxID=34508 RepID=A0A4U5NKC0_STECR|nr:hypothetical protein L596_016772 [Steinernema carpocapsae]
MAAPRTCQHTADHKDPDRSFLPPVVRRHPVVVSIVLSQARVQCYVVDYRNRVSLVFRGNSILIHGRAMKLFVLISLASLLISHSQSVFLAHQNQPCNKDRDILLAEDPTGNPNAFMRCNGVGVGSIGFWERKFCPSSMQFDFINQQCKLFSSPTFSNLKTATSAPQSSANTFNIAILNNSCVKGERCIGGTVCDLETLKCLCPYGTVAQLDTLSCVANNQNPYNPPEPLKPTPAFFGPVTNYKTGSAYNQNNGGYKNSFNQGLQQSSYNYMGANGFKPNQPYVVPAPPPGVFLPEAQPIQGMPTLEVAPGGSCSNGEKCGGGSECTYPMQLCLCPGELEAHDGKCVVPPGLQQMTTTAAPVILEKVGIGALCNQFAECDYHSTCVNGRCQCLEPMTENEGRCVLKLVPKEVGPGELCDNGEICSKGSVCDATIPVCVCAEGTDLMDGFCMKVMPQTTPYPTLVSERATYENYEVINTQTTVTQQPFYPSPTVEETYPVHPQTFITQPPTLIQTTAAPTTKKNFMKYQLGGGKQSGVGVTCRLNTDCMIGAYCNGNTSPPTCQCLSTHVNVNGRCQKVIYPGQVGCEHDLQCTTAYSGSACIDRECVCPQGSRAIEQTCVSDQIQCDEGRGLCYGGLCSCLDDFVMVNGRCRRRVSKVGEKCEDGFGCEERSKCVNGLCMCVTKECLDAHEVEATTPCHNCGGAFVPINGHCSPNDRCEGGSICVGQTCSCTEGSVESYGRCRQRPGGRCSDGQSCSGSSICELGICRCADGKVIEGHKCVSRIVPPGKSCQSGETCANGARCRFGVCMCVAPYRIFQDRCEKPANMVTSKKMSSSTRPATTPSTVTIPRISVGPGQVCIDGQICTGGSKCSGTYCICKEDEIIIDENCIGNDQQALQVITKHVKAAPGQACTENTVCTGGSVCLGKVCMCPSDAPEMADGSCGRSAQSEGQERPESNLRSRPGRPTVTLGVLCTKNDDCPNGTSCLRNVCRCPEGESLTATSCRRVVYRILPGGNCNPLKGQDCIGEAACIQNKCQCLPPLVLGEIECSAPNFVQLVSPGSPCSPTRQCFGGSSCIQGICKCKPGNVIDVNKKCVNPASTVSFYAYPKRGHGNSADQMFQKKIQEAEKTQSQSTCTPGFIYRNGRCEIQIVDIDQPCYLNEQCPIGQCVNGVCTCSGGKRCSPKQPAPQFQAQAPSYRTSGPGEDCTNGQQCCANSYCGVLSGVCECTHGNTNVIGQCRPASSAFGPQCATSSNCHRFAYCDNGYCICKAGYTFVNNFCLPPAEPIMNWKVQDNFEANKGPLGFGPFGSYPKKEEETPNPAVLSNFGQSETQFPQTNMFSQGMGSSFPESGQFASSSFTPNPNTGAFQPGPFTSKTSSSFSFGSPIPSFTSRPDPGNIFSRPSGSIFTPSRPFPYAEISQTTQGFLIPTTPSPMGFFSQPTQPFYLNQLPSFATQGTKTSDLSLAFPGEFCGNGQICLGNSFCQESYCRCPDGTYLENGVCGGSSSGTRKHKSIRRYARPLENCQNFEVCTDHSECVEADPIGFFCRCKKGYAFYRNRCTVARDNVEVVRLGAKCTDAQICADGAECIHGKCSCPQSYQELASYCLVLSQPGEPCGEGQLCRSGSVCGDTVKTCICPTGTELKQGSCEPMFKTHKVQALPGEECHSATVCVDGSYCSVKGYCSCSQDSMEVDHKCVALERIRLPGEPCQDKDVCSKGSTCSLGYCNCPLGLIARMGSCRPLKHVAAEGLTIRKIDDTDECNPKCPSYSICKKSTCFCKLGTPLEADDCIPVVEASTESCDLKTACPENTVCLHGFCACLKPNIVSENSCIRVKMSGESCNPEKDLCDEFGTCLNSTCVGQVRPGSSCGGGKECGFGSTCVDGYCRCDGKLPRATLEGCRPEEKQKVGVEGDSCSYAQDCAMELTCFDHVCTCLESDGACGSKKMIKRAAVPENTKFTAPPGGSCSEIDECSGGSVCREGWCVCPDASMIVQRGLCVQTQPKPTTPPKTVMVTEPGTPLATTPLPATLSSYNRGSLARKAAPGTNCGPLDECVGGSNCIEGYCICPAGTHANTESARCEPSESSVVYGTREPSSTYGIYSTPLPTPTDPVETPDYGSITTASIEEDIDECVSVGLVCKGGTICVDLTCQCPKNYILHNDQCVPPRAKRPFNKRRGKSWSPGVKYARPNEPCARGETCTGGSICIDKKTCLCPPQAPFLRENACIKSDEKPVLKMRTGGPGESCDMETKCTEGSYCYNGLCRCQGGYIAFSGKCIKLPSVTGPTTDTMTTVMQIIQVGPEHECGEGRICSGGSTCDDSTGLCQCPVSLVAMGGQCVKPQTTLLPMTSSYVQASVKQGQCSDDTQCGSNSNCVVGRCKCRPGYELRNGVCSPQEDVQFSKFTKPRIKGPPLRPPVTSPPKTLSQLRVGQGSSSVGVCPPGNEPLNDDFGKLVVCNGVEPKCPPRSYCYVTGVASADYNCCKSW